MLKWVKRLLFGEGPTRSISPEQLPQVSAAHPSPWCALNRGGGYYEVLDGNGVEFAYVYCHDEAELFVLDHRIREANTGVWR